MFGIGGWEFILIAVLALLLFGPDKLPQFARTIGRFMRDFKRYQDLMESTIRAEVFANDPEVKKDAFATGKEFRERVGGGGFRRQQPSAAPGAPEEPEAEGESAEATDGSGEDAASSSATADADVESGVATAEPAEDGAAEAGDAVAADTTDAPEGEGERDEA